MNESGPKLDDPNQFRRLVGKLIFLTITRLDISYSVQILNQFTISPITEHIKAANHILRYLKMASGTVIMLAADSAAHLSAYCDSDYASCPIGRKSTTGYAVQLGHSLIPWQVKK